MLPFLLLTSTNLSVGFPHLFEEILAAAMLEKRLIRTTKKRDATSYHAFNLLHYLADYPCPYGLAAFTNGESEFFFHGNGGN